MSEAGRGYLLDNRQAGAGGRLELLSAVFDRGTFRRIDELGIAPGWRCWEVGAGGPSVARWLAERVGPLGRVLATDIDVGWAAAASGGVVEVRRHDIGAEAPPSEIFDLVHARLVLVHVAQRDRALASMASALRPGGRLLVEDADPALQPLACPDAWGPEQELANRIRHAFRALLAERGADLAYGRKLPRLLREAGLGGVHAEASFPVTSPESGLLEAATIVQLRGLLLDRGLVSATELDRHLENLQTARLDVATAPMIAAWGTK